MRNILLSFLIPFSLLLSSCTSSTNKELSTIEPRLREKPDSLLDVLANMDKSRLGNRELAYYALLTTAELDINHCHLDDSLVSIAHKDYTRHGTTHQRMLNTYYYGRAQQQNKNYPEAILSLYQAAEMAREEGNLLYHGLSLRNISEIFSLEYEDIDAAKEILNAIGIFEDAGLDDYAESARLYYASILQQTQDNEKADSVFRHIIANSKNIGLVDYAYREYAYLKDINTKEDALNVLSLYENGGRWGYPAGHLARMAYAYSFFDKKTSDSLLSVAYSTAKDVIDTARIKHHQYLIAKNGHDYKEALRNYEAVSSIQDSITRLKLQQSLISSLNNVYRREGEVANLQVKNARLTAIIITSTFLFVTILLCGLLLRNRKKQKELIDGISETKKILQEREDDNLRLVKVMMMSKITELEEAARKYEESIGTRDETTEYRALRQKINTLQKDKLLYKEIETALDTYHSGIITKVRCDFPGMTEYTFHLLLLFFAHIPQSTIQLLRCSPSGTIKTAKYRLRCMFKKTNSAYKDQYLSLLDA